LSPEDLSEGAKPLDAGLFENPADWFSDDEDVVGSIGRAAAGKSEPGWRESGIEDAHDGNLASLEDDRKSLEIAVSEPAARASRPTPEPAPRTSQPPAERTSSPPARTSAPPAARTSTPSATPASPAPEKKSSAAL